MVAFEFERVVTFPGKVMQEWKEETGIQDLANRETPCSMYHEVPVVQLAIETCFREDLSKNTKVGHFYYDLLLYLSKYATHFTISICLLDKVGGYERNFMQLII